MTHDQRGPLLRTPGHPARVEPSSGPATRHEPHTSRTGSPARPTPQAAVDRTRELAAR